MDARLLKAQLGKVAGPVPEALSSYTSVAPTRTDLAVS